MSEGPYREATLAEVVERLPLSHRARIEYEAMVAARRKARHDKKVLGRRLARAEACASAFGRWADWDWQLVKEESTARFSLRAIQRKADALVAECTTKLQAWRAVLPSAGMNCDVSGDRPESEAQD